MKSDQIKKEATTMKKTIALLLALCMVLLSAAALAEWPEKEIKLVIPAGTGGDTDTTSRVLAAQMSEILGQPVTVNNMSGGSGSIACNYMYESASDGYNALYWHTDMIFSTLLHGTEKTWQEAFRIVGSTGGGMTTCLFVNKTSGIETLEQFVDYCKAHPGEMVVGTEIGSSNHILILQFAEKLGLDLNIVAIGSGSARATSLLAGEIGANVSIYRTCGDYVTSGDFNCLTIFADKQCEDVNKAVGAPVRTVEEITGVSCEDVDFYIIALPKDVDDAVFDKFSAAVEEAASSQEYKDVLAKYFFALDLKLGKDAEDNMNKWAEYYKDAADIYLKQYQK